MSDILGNNRILTNLGIMQHTRPINELQATNRQLNLLSNFLCVLFRLYFEEMGKLKFNLLVLKFDFIVLFEQLDKINVHI